MEIKDKYESDLTRKEKRQIETAKLKTMNRSEKAEYLWTYYKWVLAALVGVVFLVYIIVSMVQGQMRNEVLALVVADVDMDHAVQINELRDELFDYIGSEGRHDEVAINATVTSKDMEGSDMNLIIALTPGIGLNDAIICGNEILDRFLPEGFFKDVREFLGEDAAKYEAYISPEGVLDLTENKKWQSFHLNNVSPVYLCVLLDAPNPENVKLLIQYFFD